MNNDNMNNQQVNQQPVEQQYNVDQAPLSDKVPEATKEKQCEFGFWLSICTFVASFFFVFLIVDFLVLTTCFFFGKQGLKTKKRGKAIATMVISIITAVLVIVTFAINLNR